MTKILIIGYGKVGSHIHFALRNQPRKYSISAVKDSHTKISEKVLIEADIILITTQDDKINNAVKKILNTKANLRGKIAAHTSGALTSDELSMLQKKGALIASFHPVQTFNRKAKPGDNLFKNIYTAIEGDGTAARVLSKIARDIGSVPEKIEKEFKTLHHICCVISSSYVVSNLSIIEDIYTQKNGFKKVNFFNIYMPLIRQTISNLSADGIERSLTGPIVRNDISVIGKHIRALETLKHKEIVDYYRFIANRTLTILKRKKRITKKHFSELYKLLNPKQKN